MSTMMPSEVAVTVAAAMPTTPTSSAHTPKVIRIGIAFGTRLSKPSGTLRSASTMIRAIRTTATALPRSMLSTLRLAM